MYSDTFSTDGQTQSSPYPQKIDKVQNIPNLKPLCDSAWQLIHLGYIKVEFKLVIIVIPWEDAKWA